MHKYSTWFRRAVWLGILADWALGIPTIFAPEWVLDTLGFRATGDPVWTAFAALLVVLLSLFYIPGASDPHRYRFNAWLAVFARVPGVIFFLLLYPGAYPAFGILDGVLFLVQLPLLLLALKEPPARPVEADPGAPQAPPDGATKWFRRMVWLGILADWGLGLPAIFFPEQLFAVLGFRPTGDPVWTAFAALILVLLGAFYVPGANNPYRYRFNAHMAVWARPPGVIFFLLLWPGIYPAFGILDGVLFLLQIPFLVKMMQNRPRLGPQLDTDVLDYDGSTFREVRDVAFSGPYDELPYHQGIRPGRILQLLVDSARNLHDRRDVRPYYDKLIHSNGVAMTGVWRIDRETPYTGYLATGSEGLLLIRASVAGLFTTRGHRRSFGIAGKVYPTMDPDERAWPGNFVTVSHLSGTFGKHIVDLVPTNAPTVGIDPAANLINRLVFRIVDTRPGYRQLFPLSTLGLPAGEAPVTPDMLRLVVPESIPRVDARDFRDELRLEHYPDGKLVWEIQVKDFADEEWTRIGEMVLDAYAIAEGQDKRLHFWIPRDVPTRPKPAGWRERQPAPGGPAPIAPAAGRATAGHGPAYPGGATPAPAPSAAARTAADLEG
ncbi:MAG TPA: hypothetical protein VHQ65_03325 [Thermoanaerobaculia bacterium]|nr:hypothetical protein [Thermoanaerobaculia bacterium]